MNKNVSLVYNHFLAFTNEFSEPIKRIFLNISDTVDKYTSMTLVSLTVDNKVLKLSNSDITISNPVLSKVQSILEHLDTSAVKGSAILKVKVNDTEYDIIVENGSYLKYPKEVAKIVKSIDVYKYLYLYYSLSDEHLYDFIQKLFLSEAKVEMQPTQAILHYFDLATGANESSASMSTEAQNIANKQIEFENLKVEAEKYRTELESLLKLSKEKKESLSISKTAADDSYVNDTQLDELRADARTLKKGITDITDKLEKISKLLPEISDHLANAVLEKEQHVNLVNAQKRTIANKVTYEKLLNDNRNALENIMSRIKLLESNKIKLNANKDPESSISKDIFELDGKINSLGDQLQVVSNRISAIRKEIALFNEKDVNLKYVSKVNFADTINFIDKNYFLSYEENLVYNFIRFYLKTKLTGTVTTDKYATSFFISIFGF